LAEIGHIIVCGMGDIGYRVVELLHRLGERVEVITESARDERFQAAATAGVPVHRGDARNEALLLAARLESARAVVAATDQDLVNIEVALDVQRLRPGLPVVVRLFDQSLASQLETTFELRRVLGLSALAAPSFAAAALGDAVLASFTVDDVAWVVGRALVGAGPLAGTIGTADLVRRHPVIPLVQEHADDRRCTALPTVGTALAAGDRLSLLAHKADWDRLFGSSSRPAEDREPLGRRLRRGVARLRAAWRDEPKPLRALVLSLVLLIPLTVLLFHLYLRLSLVDAVFYTVSNLHAEIGLTDTGPEIKLYEVLVMVLGSITLATLYSLLTEYVVGARLRKLLGDRPMPRAGHVVVVGIGHVGYRVVTELVGLGLKVVAVDADGERPFVAAARTQVPLVVGDARLEATLARARLGTARAVVAATGDDSVNLAVGLTARRLAPEARTVVRLFDPDFGRKVEAALGIDVALSASRIAAPTFAAAALYPDVLKAFIVGDRLLVLLHRKAGETWAGRTPAELRAQSGIAILRRSGAAGEEPLARHENVLAALSRRVAPPWSTAPTPLPID
jgi:Trk K+ transport system NAD-binding subunit